MAKRIVLLMMIAGILSLLAVPPAAAQYTPIEHARIVEPTNSPADLIALIDRDFIPVEIHKIEAPESLAAGQEGIFAVHANVEAATLPLQCRWDFGDGATAESLVAAHRYEQPGTYRVRLVLSNGNGEHEAVDSLQVTVTPAEAVGHE